MTKQQTMIRRTALLCPMVTALWIACNMVAIDQYTKRFGASPVSGSLTDDAIFLTLDAADSWASDQYSEYGVEIDSSCFNPEDDEAYN